MPISAEVISLNVNEMVEQGKLSELGPNVVIKLPMTYLIDSITEFTEAIGG